MERDLKLPINLETNRKYKNKSYDNWEIEVLLSISKEF